MNTSDPNALKHRVENLIAIASGGNVSAENLRQAGGSLQTVGLDSISYMNLFVTLEETFGVTIKPDEDPEHLISVDSIVSFLNDQLAEAN